MLGTAMALGGGMGVGAGLGAWAGSKKDKSDTRYDSNVDAGTATMMEQQGQAQLGKTATELDRIVSSGAGENDMAAATGAQRDLAALLQQYSQGGNQPNTSDINSANNIAGQMFGAQRVAQQHAFSDQLTQANQQAALMGRDINDPILRAKLAQEQTRQGALLEAQQGAWAQQYALQLPGQRLGFAEARANVLQGLATQAMANRQALAGMGESLMNNERNMRLQTARRFGHQATESGGGTKGAITGGIAGAGTALSMGKNLMSMGGFGGGGGMGSMGGGMGPGALSGYNYNQAPSQFFGVDSFGAQPAMPQQQNPFASPYSMGGFGTQPGTFNLGVRR